MSSTWRGEGRQPDDFYRTPAWCVRRLMEASPPLRHGARVLDAAAGDGAIVRALRSMCPGVSITAVEFEERHRGDLERDADEVLCSQDFLRTDPEWVREFDFVIANPPYRLAQEFIEHGSVASRWAFLVRLNLCEGRRRLEMFRRLRPGVLVLPERPGFRERMSHTDSCAYAWLTEDCRMRWADSTPLVERQRDHAELWGG